ncbi:MAG TPA: nucleotidyltransferase domain-containing protein, partial [Phycisphaerae bacterium]|nr:nucleotidyltransferase domain-containing protein [Phycisphaerae bacterium]
MNSFILPIGTQVVSRVEIRGAHGRAIHPAGAVGIVVVSPGDHLHAYRVRFPDGFEAALRQEEFVPLREYQSWGADTMPAGSGANQEIGVPGDLRKHIIFRCVIGSRAYGLETEESDTDRRGIYLPPAEMEWSLFGVPEQLEYKESEECYWELQKFLVLALKANPNVLECLWSPMVEEATPLARELLGMREAFLSKLAYQTYNGYVMSQFKKLSADIRNKGEVTWKHVMHLLRLLHAGIGILREGRVPVRVEGED